MLNLNIKSFSCSAIGELKLCECLQTFRNAVGHAFALSLADRGGCEVDEARLHALGGSVDLELGAQVLDQGHSDLVIA